MDQNHTLRIDFTGKLSNSFHVYNSLDKNLIAALRVNTCETSINPIDKTAIIVDSSFATKIDAPCIVKDHINLTGSCPLIGPNYPCGPRFPIVNNIYLLEFEHSILKNLPRGIAGGLKQGIKPTNTDRAFLQHLGVDFCCYNLVPTVLVAAHAGWKILGIVIEEHCQPSDSLVNILERL